MACLPPLLLPEVLEELPEVPVLCPAVVLVEPEWPNEPPVPLVPFESVSSVLEPPHAAKAVKATSTAPGNQRLREREDEMRMGRDERASAISA